MLCKSRCCRTGRMAIALWVTILTPDCVTAEERVARIGVLAHRGESQAVERWAQTADYLSTAIAAYRFEIVPVNLKDIAAVVAAGRVQFILTNPGNYVDLEMRYGASRIATMQVREQSQVRVRYGAVIVTRADNQAIRNLQDLRGKSFMAVSADAFGGFQMAWRELLEQDINPFKDFHELIFAGFPQDEIIHAVRQGRVDAATVRAQTLARMIETGQVGASELRVLNAIPAAENPIPVSTRLYPEWPFATLRDTPRELATGVARALLSMPHDHPAALAARSAGWTIPMDYSPVHELMRTLQIGPYEVLRQTSLLAMLKRYAYWFAAAGLVLVVLLFLNGYISRTNYRLKETERELRNEILRRKKSQTALARYRDTLEEQVVERTEDLKITNFALERSRVALRELVRITSAPELSHDEKLNRLLDTGRVYFGVPLAVLTSVEGGEQRVCKVSGSGVYDQLPGGPLDIAGAQQLVESNGEPLDIPDFAAFATQTTRSGWRSYLGAAVLVEGKVHCTLEFAGAEARAGEFSQWDHDLLKVMAQWIGDELERQMAAETQQQHQVEFARVSRMSAIGGMAASLAHELNQPLTGAINYSSGCLRMLREGRLDVARLTEGMERAVEGATLAADIIRNIREFVQKGDAQRSEIDINRAINNVAVLVKLEARRQGVALRLQLDEHLPRVEANMIQLEQVILNFVRNGIDAMENIDPARRELTITTRADSGRVIVAIRDNGAGIAVQDRERIFDAFYTTKADGMGIGLSISRTIVESHDGRISARSRSVGGAEFSFDLPAAEAV